MDNGDRKEVIKHGCKVSGSITGGGNHVDTIIGDPACAVSVDCEGGMTVSSASDNT